MYATYQLVSIPETGTCVGTGWLPPLPDLRDYTDAAPEVAQLGHLPVGRVGLG